MYEHALWAHSKFLAFQLIVHLKRKGCERWQVRLVYLRVSGLRKCHHINFDVLIEQLRYLGDRAQSKFCLEWNCKIMQKSVNSSPVKNLTLNWLWWTGYPVSYILDFLKLLFHAQKCLLTSQIWLYFWTGAMRIGFVEFIGTLRSWHSDFRNFSK